MFVLSLYVPPSFGACLHAADVRALSTQTSQVLHTEIAWL